MAPSAHRSLAGQQLIGRVLADRYRIQAVIGTGASGRVYAAHDTRLDRPVAIKVLHAALAEDAGFQRRFRAEAQFAASLHHPNIVTVHDWGQERISDEEHLSFMVLELLEGGSLRSMLDAGTRLSPAQAARIGSEVAAALDYAHRRGIVHRDVKPANLLFDEHGVVRIADFGLARALAEASWTEPSGAVFGTARYASPEQWLGVQLDARSDLYSLALVIVESVTGDIPFSADTTIGLLSARTQRPIVAPDELGPLGAVVERAGRVDPAERYPDAGVMRSALLDAAEALPVPGPLRLAGMTEGGADPHPTRAVPPPGPARAPKATPARRAAGGDAGLEDDIEVIEAEPVVLFDQDQDPADVSAGGAPARVRRPRRLVPLAVALAVVLGIAGLAGVITQVVGGFGGGPSVAVPGLVGRPLAQAKALAEDAGLTVSTRSAPSATSDPAGIVIDQRPAAGAFAAGDAEVVLVVSSGPAKVAMPDVVGKTLNRARQELAAQGLNARVERTFDEQVEAGRVLAQATAAGTKVPGDSEVALTVSDGPEPREVPSFAGKTWNEAKAALEALGLVAGYNEDFSDSVPLGYVIATTPAAGERAERGARVTVLVSKGPSLVTVPNVIGRSLDAATVALERVGLVVDTVKGYRPGRTVRSQSLTAGSQARRGSTVDLGF